MKQGSSSRKVNEQARQILADILLFDISDPRLRDATITGCEVSFDRSYCNVFYTTKPEAYEKTAEAFARARGRIRSLMARRQAWRVTPELRFILDETIDQAERIDRALKADAARNAPAADGAEAPEADPGEDAPASAGGEAGEAEAGAPADAGEDAPDAAADVPAAPAGDAGPAHE